MPGFMFHVGAALTCTHGAPATVVPSQLRVLVTGAPVAPFASVISVAGCPFTVPLPAGPKPQPCVIVKWAMPSTRVLVAGQPIALAAGPGTGPALCLSIEQIPQGPPVIAAMQARVVAS